MDTLQDILKKDDKKELTDYILAKIVKVMKKESKNG
jgi:hypothetical protein